MKKNLYYFFLSQITHGSRSYGIPIAVSSFPRHVRMKIKKKENPLRFHLHEFYFRFFSSSTIWSSSSRLVCQVILKRVLVGSVNSRLVKLISVLRRYHAYVKLIHNHLAGITYSAFPSYVITNFRTYSVYLDLLLYTAYLHC